MTRPRPRWRLLALLLLTCGAAAWWLLHTTTESDATWFRYECVDAHGPTNPWGKAVGDLNGDGRPDLLVGGHDGGGLVWYENPTWQRRSISAEAGFATDHEIADLDGDGRNDVVSLLDGGVAWFRNPAWEMAWIARDELHDVEVADLDGDGRPDVAARGQSAFGGGGDKVILFLQGGAPQSPEWTRREIAVPPGEGLVLADIDADGWTDAVIGALWLRNPGRAGGEWISHVEAPTWLWPHAAIAVHDLSGDGRPDIVLAPSELKGGRYRIAWYEAPDGGAAADAGAAWREHVIDADVESLQHGVAVADVDLDGRMDVICAEMHQGRTPHHEVKAYMNLGGDQWEKRLIATTGSHNLHVADLDGDGDADVFGANWSGKHQAVEVWWNQACTPEHGAPEWRRHVIDDSRPGRAVFVHVADLDGDGRTDVATGGSWYRNPGNIGSTGGSAGSGWERREIGAPANDVEWLSDLDGDGDVDVLATRWKDLKSPDAGLVFAENTGGGAFAIHPLDDVGAGDFLQGVAEARLLPGGRSQLALSWHEPGHGVQLLTVPEPTVPGNAAEARWPLVTISQESQDEMLSAGDIDRDGVTDLLLGTQWLRNEGGAGFRLLRLDPEDRVPDRNRLADINGDGRLDAVVGFEAISRAGDLVWYEQGPDATAPWTQHLIDTVIGPMSLDVADMDADGDLDVVVGEHNLELPSAARLLVFENVDGRGGEWREHVVYTGDEHHDGAVTVDLDGDGDLDIVSIGWGHRRVAWYENLRGRPAEPGEAQGADR